MFDEPSRVQDGAQISQQNRLLRGSFQFVVKSLEMLENCPTAAKMRGYGEYNSWNSREQQLDARCFVCDGN